MKDLVKQQELERNVAGTTLKDFVDYYNQNVPASFPQATVEILKKFKEKHPSLFNESNEWTIDKHRKKLMDWLTSHNATI